MPQSAPHIVRLALGEDRAVRDLTSRALLPAQARIRARLVAKSSGVLAGGGVAASVFRCADPSLRCSLRKQDGARLAPGQTILTIAGRARAIFAAERTALNFLGHLSGIATLARRYVERVRGTRATIYDTRKTLPGLRALEKYAVRVGGGHNHRMDLADAVLIKTNHLRALQRADSTPHTAHSTRLIRQTVVRAKQAAPSRFVEIEVRNMQEFRAALQTRPDAILLDNWRLAEIRQAVKFLHSSLITHHSSPLLEVSGGVTLANVRAIAQTGVDRISIGRLTHSAPALDISLEVV